MIFLLGEWTESANSLQYKLLWKCSYSLTACFFFFFLKTCCPGNTSQIEPKSFLKLCFSCVPCSSLICLLDKEATGKLWGWAVQGEHKQIIISELVLRMPLFALTRFKILHSNHHIPDGGCSKNVICSKWCNFIPYCSRHREKKKTFCHNNLHSNFLSPHTN